MTGTSRMRSPSTALCTLLALSACVSAPKIAPPELPATLSPPPGQEVFLEARGSGVQIYECAPKTDQPSVYEWTFRAPEAALVDPAGHQVGRHYAGPTWESTDGSSVVGDVRARDPGPSPTAIPWLLLVAKSTTGTGVFSATTSVQRVHTVGGVAPAETCSAANTSKVARVPYTATYYFYRAAR
jgi:hypothetical protein